MRIILQRVKQAKVTVEKEIVGQIGKGYLLLLGFSNDDKENVDKKLDKWANKMLKLRLFDQFEKDKQENKNLKSWQTSIIDNDLEIWVVSQFTLYSKLNGNKPDFHNALSSEIANCYYEKFIEILKKNYKPEKIQTGKFGAKMEVDLTNDGPVTMDFNCDK